MLSSLSADLLLTTRAKKQSDRELVVRQKETNKALEEEIERLNLEQQRLKEIGNSIKIDTREATRTIVCVLPLS